MGNPTLADLNVPAPLAVIPWRLLLRERGRNRALYYWHLDESRSRPSVYLSYNWRPGETWVLEYGGPAGRGVELCDTPEQLAAYITAFLLTGAWPRVHEPETDKAEP